MEHALQSGHGLQTLSGQKWILPNVEGVFHRVYPSTSLLLQAMELALQAAGGAQPATTLICDDSLRNIAAGKAIGMHTVLVGCQLPWPNACLQPATSASGRYDVCRCWRRRAVSLAEERPHATCAGCFGAGAQERQQRCG